MIVLILLGVVVILLNVLDSVTTELGFGLPEDIRAEESNPIGRTFLKNHPIPSHIIKQVTGIGMVIVLIAFGDMRIMVVLVILFGWVVVNNSYILIGRKITKRKIRTPFYKACKACHIPENCMYFVWVALAIPTALAIGFLLF